MFNPINGNKITAMNIFILHGVHCSLWKRV